MVPIRLHRDATKVTRHRIPLPPGPQVQHGPVELLGPWRWRKSWRIRRAGRVHVSPDGRARATAKSGVRRAIAIALPLTLLLSSQSATGAHAGQDAAPAAVRRGSAGETPCPNLPVAGQTGDGNGAMTVAQRTPPPRGEALLTALLGQYDAARNVDLAITVLDRISGRSYQYRGDSRFVTASVVKVDILAALALQAQRAGRQLTKRERKLATAMIQRSDNTAASRLWINIGASRGMAMAARSLGLASTSPDLSGSWGLTQTTTADQARLLAAIADDRERFSETNAGFLTNLMSTVDPSQSWGISAAAAPGERVTLKNGWLPGAAAGDGWTINSMGRITDFDTDVVIVVLSHGHSSMTSGIALVERVAIEARKLLEW